MQHRRRADHNIAIYIISIPLWTILSTIESLSIPLLNLTLLLSFTRSFHSFASSFPLPPRSYLSCHSLRCQCSAPFRRQLPYNPIKRHQIGQSHLLCCRFLLCTHDFPLVQGASRSALNVRASVVSWFSTFAVVCGSWFCRTGTLGVPDNWQSQVCPPRLLPLPSSLSPLLGLTRW